MHPLSSLAKIDIFDEQPLQFTTLDYIHPEQVARSFKCSDKAFPKVNVRLPQRLGRPLAPSFRETEQQANNAVAMDPLGDLVNLSRMRIPELYIGNRTISEVLASKKIMNAAPTPQKRSIAEINTATPTASALKRRKAVANADADLSCDISVEGFVGTSAILRMVDQSLIDTPEKDTQIPRIQSNAPGPSPRNLAPKYLYGDDGKERPELRPTSFNPFRTGDMPPPNWRHLLG